jgi:chromosome segregation ATPase
MLQVTIAELKGAVVGPAVASESAVAHSSSSHAKRPRAEFEDSQHPTMMMLSPDAPRSLASIKETLLQLHGRRAQGLVDLPKLQLSVVPVKSAADTVSAVPVKPVTASESSTVAVRAPVEEQKQPVTIAPVTYGFHNMLMKELDVKLHARKAKLDTVVAAPTTVKGDEQSTVGAAMSDASSNALVSSLERELALAKVNAVELLRRQEEMQRERDDLLNQLELEMGANAEYAQEQRDLSTMQEARLQQLEEDNRSLQRCLEQVEAGQSVDADEQVERHRAEVAVLGDRIAAMERDGAVIMMERDAAMVERDAAIVDRDAAMMERDVVIVDRDAIMTERDVIMMERDAIIVERDAAIVDRDAVIVDRDSAIVDRDSVLAERDAIMMERDAVIVDRDAVMVDRDAALVERDAAIVDRDAVMMERDTAIVDRDAIMAERDAVMADAAKILGEREATIELLKRELEVGECSLIRLQAGLDSAANEHRFAEEAAALHASTIESLQSEVAGLKVSSDELLADLEAQRTINKEHRMQYVELQLSLESATMDHQTLSERLAASEAQCLELESEVAGRNELVDHLRSEVESYQAAHADRLAELQESLLQYVSANHTLEQEIAALRESSTALAEQSRELVDRLAQQEGSMASMNESHLSQLATYEEALSQLKEALQQSRDEVDKLASELHQRSACTSKHAGIARLGEVDLSQEALDGARKDLDRQLSSMTSDLGGKEATISKLMASVRDLTERATVAEQRLAAFDSSSVSGDADEATSKKRMGQLQTTVDLLSSEKEGLQLKLQLIEREAKSQNNEQLQLIGRLEKQLHDQLQLMEKATRESAASINELKREVIDAIIQRDSCQQRMEAAHNKLSLASKEADKLRDETEKRLSDQHSSMESAACIALQEDKQRLQDDLSELSGRLKKSQDDSRDMRGLWEEAERRCQSADERCQSAEDECKLLKSELDKTLSTIEQLTIALEEATAAETESTVAQEAYSELMAQVEVYRSNSLELAASSRENLLLLESKSDDVRRLEEEVSRCKDCGKQLEASIVDLRLRNDALDTALVSEQAVKAELTGVSKHLAEQVDALSAQLEEMQAERLSARDAMAKQESLLSQLESERQRLYERVDEETSKAADFSASVKERLSEREKVVKALTEARDAALVEVTSLKGAASKHVAALSQLRVDLQELREAHILQSSTIDQLRAEKGSLSATLRDLRSELQAAMETCASSEESLMDLQQQLATKDSRILHLEACKLTKDQMEKIKVIKEERKRFQEDNKTLKKQLQQLTSKFDELKSSKSSTQVHAAGAAPGGPSTDYVISDLKVQLVTTSQQLSQCQDEVKLVKSKLKECAVQLKHYENDHVGIVAVLERYEIDTRGILPLEHSVDDDSSALNVDIADAVALLGEKLDASKCLNARKELTKTQRVVDLEDRIGSYASEAEDLKAQKLALEKRIDTLKNTAKAARESSAALTVQVEELTERVAELQDQLSAADRKAVNSSELVSSEVQALEEENIDLLKENKELRVELSRYRSSLATSSTNELLRAPARPVAASTVPTSPLTRLNDADGLALLSGRKRTFGTDLSNNNQLPVPATDYAADAAVGSSHKKGAAVPVDAINCNKQRRMRMRAKALVDDITAPAQDEAGECKQS